MEPESIIERIQNEARMDRQRTKNDETYAVKALETVIRQAETAVASIQEGRGVPAFTTSALREAIARIDRLELAYELRATLQSLEAEVTRDA